MSANTQKSGFTLIELLVVISIIGLLASIILVGLNNARAKARDAKRLAELRHLITAFNLYINAHGDLPQLTVDTTYCIGRSSLQTCWVDPTSFYPSGLPGSDTLNNALKEFVTKLPTDPLRTSGPGDAYLYKMGTGNDPNGSGIAPGCTPAMQKGIFLLWNPDSGQPTTDKQCLGLGVAACCGHGGPCAGSSGWYCAIKLD